MGLGSDVWLWMLGLSEVLAIGVVYVGGSRSIGTWLSATSTQSTLFAQCLGLAILAWWCVIGTEAALGTTRAVSTTPPTSPTNAPTTSPTEPTSSPAD